jgi:hypothetical protein
MYLPNYDPNSYIEQSGADVDYNPPMAASPRPYAWELMNLQAAKRSKVLKQDDSPLWASQPNSLQGAQILKENPTFSQTMGQSILQGAYKTDSYRYASTACFGQTDDSIFKGRGTGGLTRKKDDICNQQKDNVTSVGVGNYMMFWDKYIPKRKCVDDKGIFYSAASPVLVDIDSQMKGLDVISSRCYDRFPIAPKYQINAPDQTICADIPTGVHPSISNVDRSMKLGYQLLR